MKKLFLLSIILFTVSCSKKDERPNILFIMSDDHAYQAISSYSDKLINTPNIDRIANDGILFSNACVTNSICAPSRAVILTGKHSHLNGKVDNGFPFDTTQVTFPQLFQKLVIRQRCLVSCILEIIQKELMISKSYQVKEVILILNF